jgi:hypothetical protein
MPKNILLTKAVVAWLMDSINFLLLQPSRHQQFNLRLILAKGREQ